MNQSQYEKFKTEGFIKTSSSQDKITTDFKCTYKKDNKSPECGSTNHKEILFEYDKIRGCRVLVLECEPFGHLRGQLCSSNDLGLKNTKDIESKLKDLGIGLLYDTSKPNQPTQSSS